MTDPILQQLRDQLGRVQPLPDAAWQSAVAAMRVRHVAAGEHLLTMGRVSDELQFLVAGLARFYYLGRTGREFNKTFAGPGQVVSSLASLLNQQPAPFSVQALQPCISVALPHAQFRQLTEQHRDWERLRTRLLEQLALKKEQREADLLLLSASQRYEKFLQEYASLVGCIPNYQIAAYLGITEVALSRIRARLKLT